EPEIAVAPPPDAHRAPDGAFGDAQVFAEVDVACIDLGIERHGLADVLRERPHPENAGVDEQHAGEIAHHAGRCRGNAGQAWTTRALGIYTMLKPASSIRRQ